MKAEELRLGNLVYCKITCSITHILKEFVGTETYDEFIQIEHIEPIQLTEEWLLKAGFKKSPANNSFFISIPKIKSEIHFEYFRGDLVCVIYCSTGSFIPNDIKYIHQLQNLYFALIGEELTIKL